MDSSRGMRLNQIPAEEKSRRLAKARAARDAKTAVRNASPTRRDWQDMPYWEELARRRGLRLPPLGEPLTLPAMRRVLSRAKRSQTWYSQRSGFRQLDDYPRANPQVCARSFAGIVFEWTEREAELAASPHGS